MSLRAWRISEAFVRLLPDPFQPPESIEEGSIGAMQTFSKLRIYSLRREMVGKVQAVIMS
jgi:hypothetical protein